MYSTDGDRDRERQEKKDAEPFEFRLHFTFQVIYSLDVHVFPIEILAMKFPIKVSNSSAAATLFSHPKTKKE